MLVARKEVPARTERADAVKPEDKKCYERAQYGARVVGRCMKPERASPRFGDRRVGEQRITSGAADALAHPVGDANRQHLRRAVRGRGKRAHDRGKEISGHDERFSGRDFVRPPSTQQLEQRRGRLSRPLDRADEAGVGAQHSCQKHRQQRIDHLRRDVGEEAHRAQPDDVASELRTWLLHCRRVYDPRTSE